MNSGFEEVDRLFANLETYLGKGASVDLSNASDKVAEQARTAIEAGLNTDGSPMAALKPSTLKAPVRRDRDATAREYYGSKPLSASGKTANSIVSKKVGAGEWEISSRTELGDMILVSNAKGNHGGKPFYGDTPKAVRDPLQVADKHLDILEDKLVEGIDRALNG